jgi:hypothetical protein
MALFRRSQPEEPEVLATAAEVDAAARQLQQGGSDQLAQQLIDRAGPDNEQRVGMAILSRAADYEPSGE